MGKGSVSKMSLSTLSRKKARLNPSDFLQSVLPPLDFIQNIEDQFFSNCILQRQGFQEKLAKEVEEETG